MKKHILLTVLFTMIAVISFADPVTPAKARELASGYMENGVSPRLAVKRANANSDAPQPLYVFSRGEGKGFVMVSGDDALPAIIGVTESGDFDENDVPPALQDMMDYYSQAAQQLWANPALASMQKAKNMRKASGTRDIAPLMTSHWHQSWPYNNLCPFIKGTTNRAVTGCVATAASQIIYYWRKDLGDRTKYNTPTYGYGDAPVVDVIPSGTPLKWDLMRDSYGGSDPAECTGAVATLLACVGASAWLTYGSSTSGQIDNCRNVFSSQFGLNGGTTVWKGSYGQSSWEKMIIQDLEVGRPILYSGVHPSNGGHAVVIDGYQLSSNRFHFNFGWGAGNGYDGYYTVDDATGMNGFNESQGMVYQIYPKSNKMTGSLSYKQDYLVSKADNVVTAKVTNNGTLPTTGIYVYCLTGNVSAPSSSASAQDSDTKTVIAPGETASFSFKVNPSTKNEYTIFLCDGNRKVLDKIAGVPSVESVAKLTLKKMTIDDGGETETIVAGGKEVTVHKIYNTKKTNITATFTNAEDATVCMPSVRGYYYKYDATAADFSTSASTKTKKNVTFEPGETADIVYDLTSLTDNLVYKFQLDEKATTSSSTPITYNPDDAVIYFKLVGADMTLEKNGTKVTVKGHYNPTIFASLATDASVSVYDMTQTVGVKTPVSAANPNALFYVTAAQQVGGTNIVAEGVCDNLELTPGYDFTPEGDFFATKATYHANQAVGKYGTMIVPFDAEVPSGMFARKVNAVKTMYLSEVDSCNLQIKGGTPYIILTAEAVDVVAEKVNVSTQTASTAVPELQGVWTNAVAGATQYIIDDADTQYFSPAEGATIPALTAYLESTRKVRVTSQQFATKDKKAVALAQQIAQAKALCEKLTNETSAKARAEFETVISDACDSLRSQPVTALQTEMIKRLEEAEDAYEASVVVLDENGYESMTSYVKNPSFEAATTFSGWTRGSSTLVTGNKIAQSLAYYMSGADGAVVVNMKKGGSISQTISDLPNGKYLMKVSVAADYDNHIRLVAGDKTEDVASAEFGPMYMTDAQITDIEVKDGTLTIGAASVEDWAKVDNFRLYLMEADPTAVDLISEKEHKAISTGIYDLMGRQLNDAPQRGVYILNGKKILK